MSKQTYTQCAYKQIIGDTILRDRAWIPTQFAQVGKKIRVDGRGGVWTVTEVGSVKSEKDANADSRDYLKQREASDVSKVPSRLRDLRDD